MKKLSLALLVLISLSSAWASGVNWSEAKKCDQGYSLMVGQVWASGQQATYFQATLSGDAKASLESQLGESIAAAVQLNSDRFGLFTGKIAGFAVEIEEVGSSSVSLNILDKSGARSADYQFYNCR